MGVPSYREHFIESRKNYPYSGNIGLEDFYQFRYSIYRPSHPHKGDPPLGFEFPNTFHEILNNLSDTLSSEFDKLQETLKEENFFISIKDFYHIEELENLAKALIPPVEQKLFGCYCVLEGCYLYRNIHANIKAHSSWIPHSDNNPKEIIKIMVYSSDVLSEQDAPIFFLTKNGNAVKNKTTRVDLNNWKSPKNDSRFYDDDLRSYYNQGYSFTPILGSRGTVIVFDNNIIHKASNPSHGRKRESIVFMIRPWKKKMETYISQKTTGSFGDKTIFINPNTV
ncbi:MAG: hypothetical protein OXB88_06325 [Bacteriovoracales bacterium]|nr:hypothetical protein [Bacteriovoracales bacterium]